MKSRQMLQLGVMVGLALTFIAGSARSVSAQATTQPAVVCANGHTCTSQCSADCTAVQKASATRPDVPGTVCSNGHTCTSQCSGDCQALPARSSLAAQDLQKVVDWATDQLLTTGSLKIDKLAIEEATGVTLTYGDGSAIQQGVLAKLEETDKGRDILAQLAAAGPGRCSQYSACSLSGDLSGATGDVLTMYEREKQEDGKTYTDFALPPFEAKDLAGKTVNGRDLLGTPTVVAFLAGHCSHSHDSFPILNELKGELEPQGVRVVGVLVNSGSVEDVNKWMVAQYKPDYDVWVYPDKSIGELVSSHLVPTYLFVNGDGMVRQKLVGFQSKEKVQQSAQALVTKRLAQR